MPHRNYETPHPTMLPSHSQRLLKGKRQKLCDLCFIETGVACRRHRLFIMLKSSLSILLLASATETSYISRDSLEKSSGPPGPSCARASFSNPRWEIENFSYIPPVQAINDTTPFLSFQLVNKAHGSWVTCDATRQNVDYASSSKQETLNCHMPQTFFQFDGESGSLTVQQTWGCSDLQPRKFANQFLFCLLASADKCTVVCRGSAMEQQSCQIISNLRGRARIPLPTSQ